jgi:transcription elongation factor GreA
MMTVSETQVAWLTQEAYDRLKQELDELVANRPVIAAKINDAREEGDLKENGGYHAAREEQAQLEARIRQLQELLRGRRRTSRVRDRCSWNGRHGPVSG